MKLQLEALDPLFFRDGRPFSMGEESYAEGIFPPLPSTVRGALRSLWMAQQLGAPGTDQDTLARNSAKISVRYFGLSIDGKLVFPAPLDLFFPEKDKPAQPMQLINPDFTSSCPQEASHLFRADTDGKTESVSGHLLHEEAMEQYIQGKKQTTFPTIRLSEFVKKENKIGIGRNNETHRTEEGLLFRLISNRFEDRNEGTLRLLLEAEGFDTPAKPLSANAVMPLGGERRSVIGKAHEFNLPQAPKIHGEFFKIILLTPALLDSWYPKHLCEEFHDLKLVAASIGKPVSVGGWDVLKQCPKPMRRAASAGSVFLFKAADEAQAHAIARKYHGNSICKSTDDLDGFGICVIAQPFDNQKNQ
jgi:CRISPR-associated protein Cmr3